MRFTTTTLLVAVTFFAAACGEEEEGGEMVLIDPPALTVGTGTETTPTDSCGPTDLCTRSIDECGVAMDLTSCESWYSEPYACADMAAYTECNCDCIGEETCDSYFACGEFCFAEHC